MCGKFARNQFRNASRYAVCSNPGGDDWRPLPTKALENEYPLVWALIQECWRSEKTQVKGALSALLAAGVAKRPTFLMIVERLEAMRPASTRTSLEDMDLDVFPKRDPRYVCEGIVSHDEWLTALHLQTEEACKAFDKRYITAELALFEDTHRAWKALGKTTGTPSEYCTISGTTARLYRGRIPLLNCGDPKTAYAAFQKSMGTNLHGTAGDRSDRDFRVVAKLSERHAIFWQSMKARVVPPSPHHLTQTFRLKLPKNVHLSSGD